MAKFNIKINSSLEQAYQQGLLPQRNQADLFYQDSSSRSNLDRFQLSSENRRILKKTDQFSFQRLSLSQFKLTSTIQKQIKTWTKQLAWDFPISSIKKIFTDHIFNTIYIWKDQDNKIVAYSICLFDTNFSHIAYVFYHPDYANQNLPIRLSLQVIIDSHQQQLKYCYLGRFSPTTGYYKRNFPGFQYYNYHQKKWQEFTS